MFSQYTLSYALHNADLAARGITAKECKHEGPTPSTEIRLLEFSKILSCLFQLERRSNLNRCSISHTRGLQLFCVDLVLGRVFAQGQKTCRVNEACEHLRKGGVGFLEISMTSFM